MVSQSFCRTVCTRRVLRQLGLNTSDGEEPHPIESNILRHILRVTNYGIQLRFVFDGFDGVVGLSRPQKANRMPQTQDINKLMHAMLTGMGLSWHTAAGEAEADCANMQTRGLVDAVWSDDGDAFKRIQLGIPSYTNDVHAFVRAPIHRTLGENTNFPIQETRSLKRRVPHEIQRQRPGIRIPSGRTFNRSSLRAVKQRPTRVQKPKYASTTPSGTKRKRSAKAKKVTSRPPIGAIKALRKSDKKKKLETSILKTNKPQTCPDSDRPRLRKRACIDCTIYNSDNCDTVVPKGVVAFLPMLSQTRDLFLGIDFGTTFTSVS